MRIECDYCLSVYHSEDCENEERAPCPFCAKSPVQSTERHVRVTPERSRFPTSPFGFESHPPESSGRTSISCPPPSRLLDEPPRHGAETPAYIRIYAPARERDEQAQRASIARGPVDDATDGEADFAVQLPPIGPFDRHRPSYDWTLPQVPPSAPRVETDPDEGAEPAQEVASLSELPPISDNGLPRDSDRPFVHSQPFPPDAELRRKTAAVWAPFGVGAIVAVFLVRGWVSSSNDAPQPKVTQGPVSVAAFLSAVDQATAVGDIEQALGALDRATRIAPRDPAVLLARAKLAVERADAAWLVRRASPGAPADGASYDDFVRAAGEARDAAEDAFRALPGSDDARRVFVNALRIFGETDRGREVASGLHDRTSPESTYALAALDLGSTDAPPERAAARLRQNAWVDGIPGKGRAALVYALVLAGDIDGAASELEKLALLARSHPASAALRALVDSARVPPAPAAVPPARSAGHHQASPLRISDR
jgi:hypothetical protein